MGIKSFFYVAFLCCSLFVTAQNKQETVESIMVKASEKFASNPYLTYNLKYALYKDNSKKPFESYTGFLLKRDNIFYHKIKETEFITFPDFSVKINKDEKAILIGKKLKNDFPLDLKKYLKAFRSKLLKSDNTTWTCELVPDKISQIMMGKIIMVINKSDYSISKQFLYVLNTLEDGKKTPDMYIEIVFSPRTKDKKLDDFLIDQNNYFSKTGNNIKTAPRFKEYHLYKDQN